MTVGLKYKLTGSGWSECTVEIDGHAATVTASYLGDALGDLTSAVAASLRGHPKSVASFWEEPGEYRWILEPIERGCVRVRILQFLQLFGDLPDEHGVVVFDAECSRVELAEALLASLSEVERTYGVAGYLEKWVENPFPLDGMRELKRLVGEARAAVEQGDEADER